MNRSFRSIAVNSRYRALLILAVVGTIASVVWVVSSDAESNNAALSGKRSADKSASLPHINRDIRLSSPAELSKAIGRALSRDKKNSVDILANAREQLTAINSIAEQWKLKDPTFSVTVSPLTAGVEVVRSSTALTSMNQGQKAEDIVLRFIRENQQLYGLGETDINDLHFVGESVNQVSGLRLMIVEQMVNGRKLFQGDVRFSLDPEGRIIQSVGTFSPLAASSAIPEENLIEPESALGMTLDQLGIPASVAGKGTSEAKSDTASMEYVTADGKFKGSATSEIVYFPLAPGVVIPAWSQTIWAKDADWYILVDASDGTLLWRKNIRSDVTLHQARFRVYVQADGSTPADSPAPQSPSAAAVGAGTQFPEIAPTTVNMLTVQNATASPNGWIDDCPGGGCTANETQTLGNNVLTCLDVAVGGNANICDTAAASVLDGNGRPAGNPDGSARNRDFLGLAPRDFQSTFLPAPQAGNPDAGQAPGNAPFRRGAVTQMFYTTNWYHDRLFTYGFTPAARNFQNNNFGGGGVGNDRVLVDAQDGQSVDNANFSTPADGTSGRSQMFLFTGPGPDRDGGIDSEILIHELTHGLSNRLIGNGAGLSWDVGGGMGEGWSDFYALSLLNNTNADNPNGNYASGAYATYRLGGFPTYADNYVYGIRRFPYSTNNSVNPLTWADVDDVTNNLSGGIATSPVPFNGGGAMEVHNVGEIWALTLWEMRSRIIADPAGANGDVPTGNNTSLSIVTDAMRLFTPSNPSFVEARNAIIDADCAANACANEDSIWGGFADRGLGYGAIAPVGYVVGYVAGHMGIGESFASPNLDVNTVTINDSTGNSSGAFDANEPARIFLNVKNPWRRASKGVVAVTATLTSSTPGVTIIDGTAVYGPIPANGNASSADFFLVRAPISAACGSSMSFTVQFTSSLGVVSRNFVVRLGVPGGLGAPVTYTRNPNPDIAIPDNSPRGVGDSLTITDDFEIADLNFRVDSLTHTFVQDLSVMLKAPNGYGTDLIALMGDSGAGGADQNNLVNTVIDQTAAVPNDLRTITAASDPFTDDFLPIFNSPTLTGIGLPTDPVGQLTRFNGLSTLGTWNVRVSDQFATDTGSLNQWSMIVTPRAFTCTAFVPTAATAYVAGRVIDVTGRPLSRATVALIDENGYARVVTTNTFGNFVIQDIPVGNSYSVQIKAKGHLFGVFIVNVSDNISGVEFRASS